MAFFELKRFFGIDLLINEENAEKIWTQANEILAAPDFRRREIAKKFECRSDLYNR